LRPIHRRARPRCSIRRPCCLGDGDGAEVDVGILHLDERSRSPEALAVAAPAALIAPTEIWVSRPQPCPRRVVRIDHPGNGAAGTGKPAGLSVHCPRSNREREWDQEGEDQSRSTRPALAPRAPMTVVIANLLGPQYVSEALGCGPRGVARATGAGDDPHRRRTAPMDSRVSSIPGSRARRATRPLELAHDRDARRPRPWPWPSRLSHIAAATRLRL